MKRNYDKIVFLPCTNWDNSGIFCFSVIAGPCHNSSHEREHSEDVREPKRLFLSIFFWSLSQTCCLILLLLLFTSDRYRNLPSSHVINYCCRQSITVGTNYQSTFSQLSILLKVTQLMMRSTWSLAPSPHISHLCSEGLERDWSFPFQFRNIAYSVIHYLFHCEDSGGASLALCVTLLFHYMFYFKELGVSYLPVTVCSDISFFLEILFQTWNWLLFISVHNLIYLKIWVSFPVGLCIACVALL